MVERGRLGPTIQPTILIVQSRNRESGSVTSLEIALASMLRLVLLMNLVFFQTCLYLYKAFSKGEQ